MRASPIKPYVKQEEEVIRANIVSPGPIETPLLEAQFGPNVGAMKDRFIAMTPMQRIGLA